MTEYTTNGVTVELVRADITRQSDVQAVVNAANAELRTGGGVAGAIHRAAGEALYDECKPLAPIRPGQAVITGAHGLPNDHVIHCLGPVYGIDTPSDTLLADCYRNALRLAEENALVSIAFPALSTGAFGYPMEEAATVAFRAILSMTSELDTVRLIRFVLFGESDLALHARALERMVS